MTYTRVLSNTAENTGISSGTTVTTANSGGGSAGNAFDAVTIGTSATCMFTTASPLEGTRSYAFSTTSGNVFADWMAAFGGSTYADAAGAIKLQLDALPTADMCIFRAYNSSAHTTIAFSITIKADGTINVTTGGTAGSFTTTWAIAAATAYRLEWEYVSGVSMTIKLYAVAGTTILQQQTSANAGWNTVIGGVRLGLISGGATMAGALRIEPSEVGSGPGLPTTAANVAPTVTVTTPVVTITKGSTASFSWTEADSDGTIASRTVTRVSGPGTAPTLTSPTTTSRSGTFTDQGTHVYQIVATDNLGATSAAGIVTVHVTDIASVVSDVITNPGAWTANGGTSPAIVGDASDATYLETPDIPAAAVWAGKFLDLGAGLITVTARLRKTSTPTQTVLVELMQGATTVISSRTFTPTTTWADYTWVLSTAETAAVTDRSDLRLRLTATQS